MLDPGCTDRKLCTCAQIHERKDEHQKKCLSPLSSTGMEPAPALAAWAATLSELAAAAAALDDVRVEASTKAWVKFTQRFFILNESKCRSSNPTYPYQEHVVGNDRLSHSCNVQAVRGAVRRHAAARSCLPQLRPRAGQELRGSAVQILDRPLRCRFQALTVAKSRLWAPPSRHCACCSRAGLSARQDYLSSKKSGTSWRQVPPSTRRRACCSAAYSSSPGFVDSTASTQTGTNSPK